MYSATGTMMIGVDGLTNEEVIDMFEAYLSNELNVHPSNIEVEYDSESGVMTYVIASDDIRDVDNPLSIISKDDFSTELELATSIEIEFIELPAEVLVTVDVIVDASNVDDDSIAADDVIQSILSQDESYDVNGEGTLMKFEKF